MLLLLKDRKNASSNNKVLQLKVGLYTMDGHNVINKSLKNLILKVFNYFLKYNNT